jgi:hypothetical protein
LKLDREVTRVVTVEIVAFWIVETTLMGFLAEECASTDVVKSKVAASRSDCREKKRIIMRCGAVMPPASRPWRLRRGRGTSPRR